jgi:hypothetical protein
MIWKNQAAGGRQFERVRYLSVRTENTVACQFYKRYGMEIAEKSGLVGRSHPRHHLPQEAGIRMGKRVHNGL